MPASSWRTSSPIASNLSERHLRLAGLIGQQWFARLLATRLVAQTADGVFQASLASAVFFNPDHQTDPKQAATGFVVLLLPYSLVGPFAGVFLDRWRRRHVLVRANLVRTVFVVATALLLVVGGARGWPFYIAALAALSVNRFYLSALSAGLPHVVTSQQLVPANSVTTTGGTFATIVGGGVGLALRRLAGAGDHGSALVAASACVGYLLAAAVAARMPAALLGPSGQRRLPLTRQLVAVPRNLAAGGRHVLGRPRAARALVAIGAMRLLFGISTMGTLLLYRNYFQDEGWLRAGLVGLGQAFAAAAIGYVLAAVVTPWVTARIGLPPWIVAVVALAAVSGMACGLPFAMGPLLVGAMVLGFATQSAHICVDTIVQAEIDDDFRGRVFSLYDMVFNLTFVVAAVIGAFVLPTDGKSTAVLLAISAGYAVTAVAYATAERLDSASISGRAPVRSA